MMLPKAAPAVVELTDDDPVCPASVRHWTDNSPYAFETVAAPGVRMTVHWPFSFCIVQVACWTGVVSTTTDWVVPVVMEAQACIPRQSTSRAAALMYLFMVCASISGTDASRSEGLLLHQQAARRDERGGRKPDSAPTWCHR
ncbi:hypothetical protein D3877_29010 [Azospirillum cavernae]|uniref:Uncharacterized protein n=1 Tax=Azospirillum cavernae TaxID=2320860 RepID=A0A418VJU0_9PROT|nr:hypothetical protein [Azospirillum cavernae]RJF76427.1 hypothetical protein D3877_29010 [Azospirillum cavernae]